MRIAGVGAVVDLALFIVVEVEGFELVVFEHASHFFDFEFADSVFLFFFLQIFIEFLQFQFSLFDLLVPAL